MDDNVLLPDRRKAIAAEIADALREAGIVGHEFEVGPLVDDEPAEIRQTEEAIQLERIVGRGIHPLGQELAQVERHRRFDAEMDDMAAPASLQRGFEQPDQILGLFLDLDVAVAQHAEGALPDHLEAGEQPVEEHADRLLHRHHADRRTRQPDETTD